MSELVARLAVQQLRNRVFPFLPKDIREMFPLVRDTLVEEDTKVPNILVGDMQDFGSNAATPAITVNCSGEMDGVVNVYRHLNLNIDIWVGGNNAPNVDGRRIVSIIYEFVSRLGFQNINWSGRGGAGANVSYVQIKRSYETKRSPILFEPTNKIYHISNMYRVEALSQTWY